MKLLSTLIVEPIRNSDICARVALNALKRGEMGTEPLRNYDICSRVALNALNRRRHGNARKCVMHDTASERAFVFDKMAGYSIYSASRLDNRYCLMV